MTREPLSFDPERLSVYLRAHLQLPAGEMRVEKFADGQSNPTFLLRFGPLKLVLRRKPPGQLLPSAHAVDREYAVLKALVGGDVPVAYPHHLCIDDSVIGSMFYVMSYQEGRIFWDPALPEVQHEQRPEYYREAMRVLAALHTVDVHKVGLSDFGPPKSYFERQLSRWSKQYRNAEVAPIEAMDKLMSWLGSEMPADDAACCLIHGDFRLDNLIYDPETARVNAVLDWELSTLGHPMADFSYFCMGLRLPTDALIRGIDGLDRANLNVPEEQVLIDQYCAFRGIDGIDNWSFYLAFSFFRLAAIAQGVYRRSFDGNASHERAAAAGLMVEPLAQMALREIGLN